MMVIEHISGYSTSGLRMMHKAIASALAEDDELPDGKKIYQVRSYPDWRRWCDLIETELENRSEPLDKIHW